MLMMPEAIRTCRLRTTARLRKYIGDNIAGWYKHVKHELGYDIENGDIRVVYGCRKTSGFGIATAFNTGRRRENTQLTFSVDNTWADLSGCPYLWNHTGSAEVKAGPFRQEVSDLSSRGPVENQCLFVNTIDVKLGAQIWQDIEELGISTPMDEDLHLAFNASTRPRDGPSRGSAGESDAQGTTNFTYSNQYYEVYPRSMSYNDAAHNNLQRAFHPSAVLHDILETIVRAEK